ncbi:MAG: hypothetical protein ACUVXH_05520 [Anaerolineae bacterium]
MVHAVGAGRAFGQRLGKLIEDEIHRIVHDCLYGTDFQFIPKGQLPDLHGKLCTHDGLVVDREGRPYAIIESKVIQKAKHATEKAAKVAREHPDLKRAHPTLRSSIAVLAGDFTPEPLRMVVASGAEVLFIPQEHLASACLEYGIEILWKDSQAAAYGTAALGRYNALTPEERKVLGQRILQPVATRLREAVTDAIADAPENPIERVWVDIFFKRGEIGHREFDSIEGALEYLRSWSQ